MQTYTFYSIGRPDKHIEIAATTDAEARQICMIELYGRRPDNIVPHAPNYSGRGLVLVRVQ